MNLKEIKEAVDRGETVIWKQSNYQVQKWPHEHYVIVCTNNNHAVALTWNDGVTMNGDEEDFHIVKG